MVCGGKWNNSNWNQFVSHTASSKKADTWVSAGNLPLYRISDVCTQKQGIFFQILFCFLSIFSGTNNFKEWGDFILVNTGYPMGNKE